MRILREDETVQISGGCTDCKKIIIERSPASPTPALEIYQPVFELLPSPGLPDFTFVS